LAPLPCLIRIPTGFVVRLAEKSFIALP